jgi:hypothetical protein
MKREEAKGYLDKMALEGRFVQELWSWLAFMLSENVFGIRIGILVWLILV